MSKDVKRFLALEKNFKKCGYSISKVWFGYKIFRRDRKILDGFNYSFPFIDVLPYKLIDGRYQLSLKAARTAWPKETWNTGDLLPLKLHAFGSYEIYGPDNHLIYFNKYYGNDWNEIAYREYDHEKEEAVKSVKVKLTKSMRQPAQPDDKTTSRRCVKACLKTAATKSPTV
jgi:hypothetical protein